MSSGVDAKQCKATDGTMTTSCADADELKSRNRKNSTQSTTGASLQLIGDYAGASSDVEMEQNNGHIVNGNNLAHTAWRNCPKLIVRFVLVWCGRAFDRQQSQERRWRLLVV